MQKKFLLSLLTALVLLGTALLRTYAPNSSTPGQSQQATAAISQTELYPVERVVDGDTIVLNIKSVKTTVRLIGIDTPEVVDPRKPVQCFGKEASKETKSLLASTTVRVRTDPTQSTYDKYGRLLAYVWREDGLFLNQTLIEEGYAHEYTYDVPYEYQKEFKAAEKSARLGQKGLWALGACAL